MLITTDRQLKEVWGDPVKTTYRQREILLEKPIFLAWYRSIYEFMARERTGGAVNIEIGSGSSFLYEHIPGLLKSNVIQIKYNDLTFDACNMPFKDMVVDNIFLIDVLHHLKEPMAFFREVYRVLRDGGRLLISDPYVSFLSYFIWRYLHFEDCNLKEIGFNHSKKVNPLTDSNLATATLLFKGDRQTFNKTFPLLKIKGVEYHTIFHSWLAGGYRYPSLLPSWSLRFVRALEAFFKPLTPLLASYLFVVIEKGKEW